MVAFAPTVSGERAAIRLVVNADGFGEDDNASRDVLRAHRDGIVTSTSIVGNCPDPVAVKAALDQAPRLGVGVHLTLAGGAPVAAPATVRSLLGPDERLPAHAGDVFLGWASGTMRPDDVERECDAQVARLRDAGLHVDHVSTRDHVGFLPTVGRAVEAVARRHGIPGIRMAMERPTLAWATEAPRGLMAAALGGLAWVTRRQMGALRHGPQTWGYFESRRLDDIRILEIIGRLGPGSHELICHPTSAADSRELSALTSPLVREAIRRRGIELCRWADIF